MIGDIEAFYLYDYDDEVKEKLYQFKGCFDFELSKIFVIYFKNYLKLKYFGYFLVPAPSSKEANIRRKFNHVEEMFSLLKMPMIKCIHKTKNVKQSDLHVNQRKQVSKRLKIDDVSLVGKKILIVDDVYTTGSTVKAMIDLVKTKHPKQIKVLVMSKTKDVLKAS